MANAANNGWTKGVRIFAPAKIATLLDILVDLLCYIPLFNYAKLVNIAFKTATKINTKKLYVLILQNNFIFFSFSFVKCF
jgi:hypothetical protein